MEPDECFRILEVAPTASADEVRRSYRTLVNVWHPDRFTNNQAVRVEAERKLKAINEAFATLEAQGLPRHHAESRAPRAASLTDETPQPVPEAVPRTLRLTTIVVLMLVFWLGLSDRSMPERFVGAVVVGVLLGSALSEMVLVVIWSFRSRPQTWIVFTGASVAAVVWVLEHDPTLGPALGVAGLLGGILLVFILFYVRSQPLQSARMKLWGRLVWRRRSETDPLRRSESDPPEGR